VKMDAMLENGEIYAKKDARVQGSDKLYDYY